MKITAPMAIAAVVGAPVAFMGGRALGDLASESFNKKAAKDEAKAQREWDAWSAKLDAGFADRKLDTPARHAAFDEFIKSNPPPEWVSVSHDPHANRIGIRASASGALDPGTDAYGTGLAMSMGGVGLGFGGAMLATSANRLAQVGGGALLGAAAGTVIAGITGLGSNGESPHGRVADAINAREWYPGE